MRNSKHIIYGMKKCNSSCGRKHSSSPPKQDFFLLWEFLSKFILIWCAFICLIMTLLTQDNFLHLYSLRLFQRSWECFFNFSTKFKIFLSFSSTIRPGAKWVWGATPPPPWACFSRQIGNFSRQNGEVTLKCVSLMQIALLYMHKIWLAGID